MSGYSIDDFDTWNDCQKESQAHVIQIIHNPIPRLFGMPDIPAQQQQLLAARTHVVRYVNETYDFTKSNTYVSRDEFVKRFHVFSYGMLAAPGFPWDHAHVVGGSVVKLMNPQFKVTSHYSDVDIWVFGTHDERLDTVARILAYFGWPHDNELFCAVQGSVVFVYRKGIPRAFQIVCALVHEPVDIFALYDSYYCRWGFDGSNVYTTTCGLHSFIERQEQHNSGANDVRRAKCVLHGYADSHELLLDVLKPFDVFVPRSDMTSGEIWDEILGGAVERRELASKPRVTLPSTDNMLHKVRLTSLAQIDVDGWEEQSPSETRTSRLIIKEWQMRSDKIPVDDQFKLLPYSTIDGFALRLYHKSRDIPGLICSYIRSVIGASDSYTIIVEDIGREAQYYPLITYSKHGAYVVNNTTVDMRIYLWNVLLDELSIDGFDMDMVATILEFIIPAFHINYKRWIDGSMFPYITAPKKYVNDYDSDRDDILSYGNIII